MIVATRAPVPPAVRRVTDRLDHPAAVGVTAAFLAIVFATFRALVAGKGTVSRFIILGTKYVVERKLPERLPHVAGPGYDGEFYYRLALDPVDFSKTAFGITFDNPERLDRVVYSMLAWLAAAGHASLVPWSLVAVNLVALGVLSGIGSVFARDAGRHCLWGLLLGGYFGFLWSLGRDLTEIVASVFLAAGLLALRRHRSVAAGLSLGLATLSRETALATVGAVALAWLASFVGPLTRRQPFGSVLRRGEFAAWLLPLLMFVGWQLVIHASTGTVPFTSSRQANVSLPFAGFLQGFRHYLDGLPKLASLVWFWELAVLVVVVVTTAKVLRTTSAFLHERLAWVAVLVVVICLAKAIWLGDVGFRSLDDLWVLSVILLLGSGRRLSVVSLLTLVTWGGAALQLILFL